MIWEILKGSIPSWVPWQLLGFVSLGEFPGSRIKMNQVWWSNNAASDIEYLLVNSHMTMDIHCFQWENPLFRLGHGFKFANCKRLPKGIPGNETSLDMFAELMIHHSWEYQGTIFLASFFLLTIRDWSEATWIGCLWTYDIFGPP